MDLRFAREASITITEREQKVSVTDHKIFFIKYGNHRYLHLSKHK